jgi:hypothetical protein
LALPSDPAESFVREVDENLRRDQLRDMAQSHGKWIALAVVLLLVAVGGFLFWQDRQKQQAAVDSETISTALDKVASGNVKAAREELAPLADSSNDMTRASAIFGQAALALRQNDRKTAIDLYRKAAGDEGLPQAYRDLATVRLTLTEFDQLKPDEIITRLSELAQPGKPFFGTAGEMTGMAMIAKGDRTGAGQLFARIAADKQVPQSVRARAVQIAGSLGVDATASIPNDPAATPAL